MSRGDTRPIKVVMPLMKSWTGGTSYQRNLSEALSAYAPHVKLVIIGKKNKVKSEYNKFISYSRKMFGFIRHEILNKITRYDYFLQRKIEKVAGEDIDIAFQYISLKKNIAQLVWIPDFQHVHLPEMFSDTDVKSRDIAFRRLAENATLVLLSSQDSFNDFSTLFPQYRKKARVMSFVANLQEGIYQKSPNLLLKTYNLPEKFFYLPSQFWKHKNHCVVFEAMRILRNRGIRPFLVLTGNPFDYRSPMYFTELFQRISTLNLLDQIAFLGFITYEHVLLLMRQCISVINASLFEGWSTTVEEAKSLGKRILTSNLNVHIEQNPPGGVYFDPRNPEDLAEKLEEIWKNIPPGPDHQMEEHARAVLPGRMREYADTFVSIAREAIEIVRK